MKILVFSLIISSVLPIVSFANGSSVRGGGDPCEDRIKIIREEIKAWVLKDGVKTIRLPNQVSAQDYQTNMISAMSTASIACVSEEDPGFPVEIDGTPKVCRFDKTPEFHKITCDYLKFLQLAPLDQARLIHHEYAGLAGLENPNGSDSSYQITNQIKTFEIAKKNPDQCKGSLDVMLRTATLYNDTLIQCAAMEAAGEQGSRYYEAKRRISREAEDIYRTSQKICYLSCEDTFFCEMNLSGACNK